MNTVYRIVWNAVAGNWVVASELTKGRRKSGSSKHMAVAAVLATGMLGGLSGTAHAAVGVNGNPQETTGSCKVTSDDGSVTWTVITGANCLVPSGTSASGQGNPGANAIFYASNLTNGSEDSLNLGGYLDVWKTATFHSAVNMSGQKITNLANGTLASDAVNLSQLNAAQAHYYSINDGGTQGGNYTNNGAAGIGSIAVGVGASTAAGSANSMAMGNGASATGTYNTAIGAGASTPGGAVYGNYATAVGANSTANIMYDTAIGAGAVANSSGWTGSPTGAVAVGAQASATGNSSIAIGQSASATGSTSLVIAPRPDGSSVTFVGSGTAIGSNSFAGMGGVAFGSGANATATISTAFGLGSSATAGGATALGGGTLAQGSYSLAAGEASVASGNYSIAEGKSAWASGTESIAMGRKSIASNTDAMALGANTSATGVNSLAMGNGAQASGTSSISIGTGNLVNGNNSGAHGDPSTINGNNSYSVGNNNTISSDNAFVMGNTVNVGTGLNGAVVLGNNSTVAAATATPGATIGGNAFTFAGGAPAAGDVVSIGSSTAPRQLQNVAAGQLSATSTDAVNGSELFATNQQVTTNATNIANNTAFVTNVTNGGGIKYFHTNSTLTDSSATGVNATAIGPTAAAMGQSSVAMGYGASTNVAAANSIAIGLNATASNSYEVAIGTSSQASGIYGTAVGYTAAASGDYSTALGITAKGIGAMSTALGYNTSAAGNRAVALGSGASVDVNADSSMALGRTTNVTASEAVALGHNSVADRANTVSVGNATQQRQVVNMSAGTQSTDAVNVSQLQPVVNALGGNAALDPTTGVVTGPSYTLSNADAIAGGTGPYTTVSGALTDIDNALGKVNTIANKGFNISTDGGATSQNIAPGGTVQYAAGTNATVSRSGSTIAYGVVANPTFTGTVTANGGLTVGAGQSVSMGGNKITNVAAGTVAAGSTDAVNGSQLAAAQTHYYSVNDNGTQGGNYTNNGATGLNAMAGGVGAIAGGTTSVAWGAGANSSQSNAVAVGSGAQATGIGSIVLGAGSTSSNGGMVMGMGSSANGYQAVGIGRGVVSSGLMSINIGNISSVTGDRSGAIGSYSVDSPLVTTLVSGTNSYAFGNSNILRANNAFILGNNVTLPTGLDGAVVLGNSSTVSAATATPNATISGKVYTFAGGAPAAGDVISVGSSAKPRQIQNVAAGQLSATSTDAVNGSQLFATNSAIADAVVYDSSTHAKVTLGNAGTPVQLTNVKNGALSASSSDAVNGSQLYATNQQVTQNTSDISTLNTNVAQNTADIAGNTTSINTLNTNVTKNTSDISTLTTNVAQNTSDISGNTSSINTLNTQVTQNKSDIAGNTTSINTLTTNVAQNTTDIAGNTTSINNINGKLADAVMYDSSAHDAVTLGGASATAPVQLTNVKNGDLSSASADAVNGSQLYATNQAVTQNTTDIAGNTTSINTLNTQVTQNTSDIAGNTTAITNLTNNITNGTVGLVQQAAAGADLTVGKDTDGAAVDFADKNGNTRTLKNVTAGVADTDAVNMSQLNATNANVTQNTADIAGNTTSINALNTQVTQNTSDIAGNTTSINNINGQLADAVMYDSSTHDKVTLGGTSATAPVQLTNVKNGDLSSASTDAVNGSQLYATNQNVAQNTSDIATNTTNIAGNTTAITNLTNNITNGTVGLVQQATAGADLTVGKGTDGAAVDFADKNGATRTLKNVTAGVAGTDAVNMSQLNATNANVTQNTSDIAGNTSSINTLNTNVAQNTSDISTLTTNVTQNTADIAGNTTSINNINGQLADAVMYDSAAHDKVTLGGASATAPVQLTNVKNGDLSAASTDAVNGSQLYATNQNVAHNTSDITTNATNIAGNTTAITNLTNNITNGTVGLVQQAASGADLTVGKDTDGAAVDFADKNGNTRTLKNVTAGVNDTDAVNMSQLNATNANVTQNTADIAGNTTSISTLNTQVTQNTNDIAGNTSSINTLNTNVAQNTSDITTINGQLADAVMYDSSTHDKVTLGGTSATAPVQLTNVKNGDLSSASTDAVNGSQLYATNQNVAQNTSDITTNTTSIAGNTTAITNLTNNITNGTVGLVQQAAAGADLTVGKDTDGTAVDFADKSGTTRTLKNVTAGVADTDAVNMSQLNATNANVTRVESKADQLGATAAAALGGGTSYDPATGALSKTSFGLTHANAIAGSSGAASNVGEAFDKVDAALGAVNQSVVDISNQFNNGTVGLVQQAAAGADLTVGKDTDGAAVDFADKNGNTRTLKNVTAGVNDTDAVNMSQLNATNANVTQNTADIAGNTTSISTINTQVTQNTKDIAGNTSSINTLNTNVAQNTSDITTINGQLADAVMYDSSTHDKVTLGGASASASATAPVQLTNVKNGDLSSASTDAVNGSQLYATNANVAQNTSDIAGNMTSINTLNTQVTQNTSDIAGNTTSINNINGQLADAVMYDSSTHDKVTLGGTGATAPVQLTNVKNGDLSATSTDAVNGSQLYATNQQVAQNTTDISNISNQVNNGTVGLVQQAAAGADLTVGKDTDGAAVDFADKNGNTRTLKNVTAGVNDTDAVNMSQLNATNANVTQNTADIAGNTTSINAINTQVTQNTSDIAGNTGAINTLNANVAQNTSDIAGNTVSINTLNTKVAQNTSDITTINGQLADAVMYDSSTHDKVTLGGASATALVQLTNVKNGDLSAASTDAVNGSQLYATNQQVAQNTTDISNISNQVNNGTVGLVQQTAAGADLTVGKGTDGAAVDFADKSGATRTLKNVTAGVADTDAVNMSQLNATNANVTQNTSDIAGNTASINNLATSVSQNATAIAGNTASITTINGKLADAVMYDSSAHDKVTLGKAGTPVQLTNVKNGDLSAASTDAVNGSQLYATNQQVAQNTTDIAGNTTAISNLSQTINNITNNGAGIKYFHANSTQADAMASGANAVAAGGNAQASGNNAVAVGSGAQATQANSVALGSGSKTSAVAATTSGTIAGTSYTYAGGTPTGTVSVGSAGSERTVTNVAAGQVSSTSTDAVNGSQLYATNQAVNQLDSRVGNVENSLSNVTNTVTNMTNNVTNGQSGMFQVSADSNGTQPVASGQRATAGGNGSVASGSSSTAVGNGAQATGSNSVAVGADAVADRDNTVSVGSAGKERQITNVAAGTADTDAVNVSQLKSAGVVNGDGSTNKAVTYDNNTDGTASVTLNSGGDPTIIHNVAAGRVSSDAATVGQVNDAMQQTANWAKNYTDQAVTNVSRQARAGSASAIAVASLPQAYQPSQNSVGVAFGTYQGQNAVSVGMSAISESGRYIVKFSATGSQHGGGGAGIGAGMVW